MFYKKIMKEYLITFDVSVQRRIIRICSAQFLPWKHVNFNAKFSDKLRKISFMCQDRGK